LQAVQSASIRKSFFHGTAYEGMGDDLILTANMLYSDDAPSLNGVVINAVPVPAPAMWFSHITSGNGSLEAD